MDARPERPERPQGWNLAPLRAYLGLKQGEFAALLGTSQSTISLYERKRPRDDLPQALARRYLEVWDCFPAPPMGGYDEIFSRLLVYRKHLAEAQATVIGVGESYPLRLLRGLFRAGTVLWE